MSVYRKEPGGPYYVEFRRRGCPRLRLSSATTHKSRAEAMERTLDALRVAGRRDILGLLKAKRLRLVDVHEDYVGSPARLEHRIAELDSPPIGGLTDDWFAWLESPQALSKRSHRPFAPMTVARYRQSWARLFAALPSGRTARLRDLTSLRGGTGARTGSGGIVDHRLARRMLINQVRLGRLRRDEVCDAHPELIRAAQRRDRDQDGLSDLRGDQPANRDLRVRSSPAGPRTLRQQRRRTAAPGRPSTGAKRRPTWSKPAQNAAGTIC